jgi:toxin ParE1/3/4
MKLRYTPYARDNLANIRGYITQHNPQAALRVVRHIRQQAELLCDYPNLGKEGRCEGTRELIISLYPYIVAYRIDSNEVQVLAVIHTSTMWPETI